MNRPTVMAWSDGGSACEYYRLRVPLEHLASKDMIDVRIGGQFQLPRQDVLPDVVIGQRVNRPEPAHFWNLLATGALGPRPRMIYELDDDLFHVEPDSPVHEHYSKPETSHVILASLTLADVVTVSTQPLADEVRRQVDRWGVRKCPPVCVIPNALPRIAYASDERRLRFGAQTVGWAGSVTHRQDFDVVTKDLADFLKRNPRWQFMTIGPMFPRVAKAIAPRQRRRLAWIRDMSQYYSTLDNFDVGIIPIQDNAFNRSKSDIKFLEYAARRIPAVASWAGPYEQHCRAGLCLGAQRNRRVEWGHALRSAASGGQRLVQRAYEYAWSRRVDSVEDKWWEVISGGGSR
jgi:glycosyltransferase involved in cell wall biosynthesis